MRKPLKPKKHKYVRVVTITTAEKLSDRKLRSLIIDGIGAYNRDIWKIDSVRVRAVDTD